MKQNLSLTSRLLILLLGSMMCVNVLSEEKTYTLVTDVSNLSVNDKVILVGYNTDNDAFALGIAASNNRKSTPVTISNDEVTVDIAAQSTDEKVYELTLGQSNGKWTFMDAANSNKYLNGGYRTTGNKPKNNNYLQTQIALSDAYGEYTIVIDAETGIATITNASNFYVQFNPSCTTSKGVTTCGNLFATYNQAYQPVYIYKENSGAPATYTAEIADGLENGSIKKR